MIVYICFDFFYQKQLSTFFVKTVIKHGLQNSCQKLWSITVNKTVVNCGHQKLLLVMVINYSLQKRLSITVIKNWDQLGSLKTVVNYDHPKLWSIMETKTVLNHVHKKTWPIMVIKTCGQIQSSNTMAKYSH